jgi:cation transport ATPase
MFPSNQNNFGNSNNFGNQHNFSDKSSYDNQHTNSSQYNVGNQSGYDQHNNGNQHNGNQHNRNQENNSNQHNTGNGNHKQNHNKNMNLRLTNSGILMVFAIFFFLMYMGLAGLADSKTGNNNASATDYFIASTVFLCLFYACLIGYVVYQFLDNLHNTCGHKPEITMLCQINKSLYLRWGLYVLLLIFGLVGIGLQMYICALLKSSSPSTTTINNLHIAQSVFNGIVFILFLILILSSLHLHDLA